MVVTNIKIIKKIRKKIRKKTIWIVFIVIFLIAIIYLNSQKKVIKEWIIGEERIAGIYVNGELVKEKNYSTNLKNPVFKISLPLFYSVKTESINGFIDEKRIIDEYIEIIDDRTFIFDSSKLNYSLKPGEHLLSFSVWSTQFGDNNYFEEANRNEIIINFVFYINYTKEYISECEIYSNFTNYIEYVLESDVSINNASCILLRGNDIILNCNGKTITGNNDESYNESFSGILIDDFDNVKIKNCTIKNFGIGLNLLSNNPEINNNTITNNQIGVSIYSSKKVDISNNSISNNIFGIYAFLLNDSNFINNKILNNSKYGLRLLNSSNNSIKDSLFLNNDINAIFLTYSPNNNILNNNIIKNNNGIKIYSSNFNTISGNIFSENKIGGYIYASSINNTIRNNHFINNTNYALSFLSSDYNNIIGNNIDYNKMGLRFSKSKNNEISKNSISYNSEYGILLEDYSEQNIISENVVTENLNTGISLENSPKNEVSSNTVCNNKQDFNCIGEEKIKVEDRWKIEVKNIDNICDLNNCEFIICNQNCKS